MLKLITFKSVNASVVEFARFEVGEGIGAANDFEAEAAATMQQPWANSQYERKQFKLSLFLF